MFLFVGLASDAPAPSQVPTTRGILGPFPSWPTLGGAPSAQLPDPPTTDATAATPASPEEVNATAPTLASPPFCHSPPVELVSPPARMHSLANQYVTMPVVMPPTMVEQCHPLPECLTAYASSIEPTCFSQASKEPAWYVGSYGC